VYAQLGDLLLKRHALEQVLHARLDIRVRVLVRRHAAVLVRRARVEREVEVATRLEGVLLELELAPRVEDGRGGGEGACGEREEREREQAGRCGSHGWADWDACEGVRGDFSGCTEALYALAKGAARGVRARGSGTGRHGGSALGRSLAREDGEGGRHTIFCGAARADDLPSGP
jgi:hypothetical protein